MAIDILSAYTVLHIMIYIIEGGLYTNSCDICYKYNWFDIFLYSSSVVNSFTLKVHLK